MVFTVHAGMNRRKRRTNEQLSSTTSSIVPPKRPSFRLDRFVAVGVIAAVILLSTTSSRGLLEVADASTLKFLAFDNPNCIGQVVGYAEIEDEKSVSVQPSALPKSAIVQGRGYVELFLDDDSYAATIMPLEGCATFGEPERFRDGRFVLMKEDSLLAKKQVSTELQKQFSTAPNLRKSHLRIVFSATSSTYMGFQTFVNAYAFLQSNQTSASWMRLLTTRQPDDLAELLPTFTAPRTMYTESYNPINKPDIIDKWFHSKDAPNPDDTILVIDPDNWLLRDMSKWVSQVSSKRALGMKAYYDTFKEIQGLWQLFCRENCQNDMDPVGVPYLIKASDLKEVAPLWRSYTIEIKERLRHDSNFSKQNEHNGINWSAEMFGYNFACAHLNIKTEVLDDMQIRDVEFPRTFDELKDRPMIHMGRAFFPNEHAEAAEKWRNTDGADFKDLGIQVWCKSNSTAPEIVPWPIPNGVDFVSYHTLRLLHESTLHFGPMPRNEAFRNAKAFHLQVP